MNRYFSSIISQMFGHIMNIEFPKKIQIIINRYTVKKLNADLSEFEEAESFSSLNKLFTRKLIKKRNFDIEHNAFISPCDSVIMGQGKIDNKSTYQIKGMEYNTDDLLGDNFTQDEKDIVNNGNFINFYLSPRDYHRYHIPTDCTIESISHIPGKFLPVNLKSLKTNINLFAENERVVVKCISSTNKTFYMVLVSALNVGKIKISFDKNIQTNANANAKPLYQYNDGHKMKKGDELGNFEIGSTVVILSEEGFLELHTEEQSKIKFGDVIATSF